MNYEKIITQIKSVREFKSKKVDFNLLSMIISDLASVEKLNDSQLDFVIIEDGKKFAKEFDGKIGYYGKMIPAPSYILVFGENTEEAKVNAGFCLEWVRFALWKAQIGSCWISTMENVDYPTLFSKENGETLLACIGVGEEYSGFFRKNTNQKSERKGVAEFVYTDSWGSEVTWDELKQLGLEEIFYLTKLAPSWGNEQPWKFLIEKNECKLFINRKDKNFDIETGIVSLFFVKACESNDYRVKASFPPEETAERYGDYVCQVIFTL